MMELQPKLWIAVISNVTLDYLTVLKIVAEMTEVLHASAGRKSLSQAFQLLPCWPMFSIFFILENRSHSKIFVPSAWLLSF